MTITVTGHLSDGSELVIFNGCEAIFNILFDIKADLVKQYNELSMYAPIHNLPHLQNKQFHEWKDAEKSFLILKHYEYLVDIVTENVFTHFTVTYDSSTPLNDYLETKVYYGERLATFSVIPASVLTKFHCYLNSTLPDYVDEDICEINDNIHFTRSHSYHGMRIHVKGHYASQFYYIH